MYWIRSAPRIATATAAALLALTTACRHEPTPEEQLFLQRIGTASVTVFPTSTRIGNTRETDTPSAQRIVAYLNESKLARAEFSPKVVPLRARPQMHQGRMWDEACASFGEWLRENPVSTDYALVVEILRGGRVGVVGALHCYVIDREGKESWGLGLNDHHKSFARVKPTNADECATVIIDEMVRQLAPLLNAPRPGE